MLCPLSLTFLFLHSFHLSFSFLPTVFVKHNLPTAGFCQSCLFTCFVISSLLSASQICLALRLCWTAYHFLPPATLNEALHGQQPPLVRSARESHTYHKHAASYSAITFIGVRFSSEAKGIWQEKKYTKGCSIGVSLTKSTAKENSSQTFGF